MAIVEATELCKRYGSKVALDHINLTIEEGRITGLLGPNGSGKTTFIKILAGILSTNGGTLLIKGNEVGVETKKIVSYLPDVSYINDNWKVQQVIQYFVDFYADFQQERALHMLSHLKIDLSAKYKTLSKGMKEKVQLVLVMSRDADLYLLDEPIAGVDPASREYILNTIIQNYNQTGAILISTHLIADIESILDDVIFIHDGKVMLQSKVDDIRSEYGQSVDQYFREVYRCSGN